MALLFLWEWGGWVCRLVRCADRLREAGFSRIEIVGTDDERVKNAVKQCLSYDF